MYGDLVHHGLFGRSWQVRGEHWDKERSENVATLEAYGNVSVGPICICRWQLS
jgi:hypothetical protein